MEPCSAEAGVHPFRSVKKGEHVSHTVPLMNLEGLAAGAGHPRSAGL